MVGGGQRRKQRCPSWRISRGFAAPGGARCQRRRLCVVQRADLAPGVGDFDLLDQRALA